MLQIKITGNEKTVAHLNKFISTLPKVTQKIKIQIAKDVKKELINTLSKRKRWTHRGRRLRDTFHVSSPNKKTSIVYSDAPRRAMSADKGTAPFTVNKFNPFGHTWQPQRGKGIEGRIPPFKHVANRPLNYIKPSVQAVFNRWRERLRKELRYKKLRGG